MSFPTVYYITQVIPSCYSAGYAMCVCVSFGACVYRSLAEVPPGSYACIYIYIIYVFVCVFLIQLHFLCTLDHRLTYDIHNDMTKHKQPEATLINVN